MKKRKFPSALAAALTAAGGISLLGQISCGAGDAGGQGAARRAPQVRVAPAERGAISESLDLTGSVEPRRTARLASPAEGPVRDLRLHEGDRVGAGEIVLSIGRTQGVDALVVSLREEYAKERENLSRTRQLVESGALPGEHLDEAAAGYERARAQLVKAEEAARDYSVTAPWDGIVSRLYAREGDFVSPRAPLVEVYDPGSLVIRAEVPERYAAGIRAGMPVTVRLDAYPGVTFESRLTRVYPYLDPRMRTRTIELDPGSAFDLLPGMFARLELKILLVEDAVVVPIEAVVAMPKGTPVVFVVEGGRAAARPVRTGIEESGRIEIVAGIAAGDSVITAGNEKLSGGAPVRVVGAGGGGKDEPRSGPGATAAGATAPEAAPPPKDGPQ